MLLGSDNESVLSANGAEDAETENDEAYDAAELARGAAAAVAAPREDELAAAREPRTRGA